MPSLIEDLDNKLVAYFQDEFYLEMQSINSSFFSRFLIDEKISLLLDKHYQDIDAVTLQWLYLSKQVLWAHSMIIWFKMLSDPDSKNVNIEKTKGTPQTLENEFHCLLNMLKNEWDDNQRHQALHRYASFRQIILFLLFYYIHNTPSTTYELIEPIINDIQNNPNLDGNFQTLAGFLIHGPTCYEFDHPNSLISLHKYLLNHEPETALTNHSTEFPHLAEQTQQTLSEAPSYLANFIRNWFLLISASYVINQYGFNRAKHYLITLQSIFSSTACSLILQILN